MQRAKFRPVEDVSKLAKTTEEMIELTEADYEFFSDTPEGQKVFRKPKIVVDAVSGAGLGFNLLYFLYRRFIEAESDRYTERTLPNPLFIARAKLNKNACTTSEFLALFVRVSPRAYGRIDHIFLS